MEQSIKSKLKSGFTIARWGIDICLGALFIVIALAVSGYMKGSIEIIKMLMIPFIMCIIGIIVFVIGRVIVGLQSRELNLHTDRPLHDEESWFVACMLELEETGAGANFINSAARVSGGSGDNIAAGAAAAAVTGRFFKIGKKYMGRSLVINRLPALISLAVAIVIVVMSIV